jgi:hypothetical protein
MRHILQKNAEIFYIKAGGKYSYHCALKGYCIGL